MFLTSFHSLSVEKKDSGTVHTIDLGEGGEQRSALMPLLFSLGQHGVLQKLHSEEV